MAERAYAPAAVAALDSRRAEWRGDAGDFDEADGCRGR